MSGTADPVVRLLLVPVGYACACLAASATLHVLWLAPMDETIADIGLDFIGPALMTVPFIALFIAYVAFVPAVVAIVLAELAGLRSVLGYAIAGGAVAVAGVALFWRSAPDLAELGRGAVENPLTSLSLLAAGMMGGIAHWAVVGRLRGRRDAPRPATSADQGQAGERRE